MTWEENAYIVKDSSWVHSKSFSYGYNPIRAAASAYIKEENTMKLTDFCKSSYDLPIQWMREINKSF